MSIAERLTLHLHGLAAQRLGGGDLALLQQQHAEVVDLHERVRIPIAEGITHPLQRLAEQRLSGGEVALGVQQHAMVAHGGERRACDLRHLAAQRLGLVVLDGACVLAIRALSLGPCTQKLDAQRIVVLVPALAAAEGR
eukprot:scaffold10789_cov36-Phaeocystis_antarctica.AAC.1